MDKLLDWLHYDSQIHESALRHCVDKGYSQSEIVLFSQPECWDLWAELIEKGEFHTNPTTECYVDKKSGSSLSYKQASERVFVDVRKIYVMTKNDRVLWHAIYLVLYRAFSHLIHERCCSYKKGESTRKVVKRISSLLSKMDRYRGTKHDLTKYFDSVPIWVIDALFDELEALEPSALWKVIREFYHDNRIIVNGEMVEKYCSLKQGCAVSAFLSNLVLRDIDEMMSHEDVVYYRYSDDCMIIGSGAKASVAAYKMQKALERKGLSFNAKKTESIDERHWVTFLGFKMRKGQITVSGKTLKKLTHMIKSETVFKCKKLHRALTDKELSRAIDNIQYSFFIGCPKHEAGYAPYLFGAINDMEDLRMLDEFAKDCIRAACTNKCDIAGLSESFGEHGIRKGGIGKDGREYKGRNNAMNLAKTEGLLERLGWYSLVHMFKKYHQGTDVYKAEVQRIRNGETYEVHC